MSMIDGYECDALYAIAREADSFCKLHYVTVPPEEVISVKRELLEPLRAAVREWKDLNRKRSAT